MTATALRGQRQTDPRAVNRATNRTSSEEVLDFLRGIQQEMRATGRRISLLGLERLHRRWLESAQSDWDFGAFVLTYADPTGETATSRVLVDQVRRALP